MASCRQRGGNTTSQWGTTASGRRRRGRAVLRRYGRRQDGSEPSHTGDDICSNAVGKSLTPPHVGDGICSDATGDGSCFFPGATGNSICSDVTGDGSCSVPRAVGDGICADATGDSRGRSPAGRPVPHHGLPCESHGDSLKPSHTSNGHLLRRRLRHVIPCRANCADRHPWRCWRRHLLRGSRRRLLLHLWRNVH